MKKTLKTIVFFGSGPVAAKSLSFLASNFDVEAVITKPRPPHHKGSVPVLELSKKLNIKVYTVTNKQDLEELLVSSAFNSTIGVLIDFAIIVSKKSIGAFPLGIVNSHFSLLPEWRGPAPITYSILSGQKYSGTSLMLLAPGVDEGPLLAQAKLEIPSKATTKELTENLIELSNQSLKEILPLYIEGKIDPAPQELVTLSEQKSPSFSHKISKSDGVIDWNKPAYLIEREIRAFAGWPGCRTILFNKDVILTKAVVSELKLQPGILSGDRRRLIVGTSNESIEILRLKPAGKKEMDAQAFLTGVKG